MKRCDKNGCYKDSQGYSKYCGLHRGKKQEHGHIDGRSIRKREYARESLEVSSFIQKYSEDSEAIQCAIKELSLLINNSETIPEKSLRECFQMLKAHNVSPLDMVMEITSLYLFSGRYPTSLPDDIRLTFMYGRSVLRLGSTLKGITYNNTTGKSENLYKRTSGKSCKEMGTFLRRRYSGLISNLKLGIKQHNRMVKLRDEILSKPFTINDGRYLTNE